MPNVVCPTCGITLAVSDEMVGNQVQCGGCQQIFLAEAPKPKPKPAPRDEDDDDRRDRPSRRRSRREEDDEDDRPGRRRSRREDDDGDEYADRRRRSRPRRYEDDDDYDDRPTRAGEGGGNGMAVTGMILGIISVTVELPAMMVTAFDTVFCCGAGSLLTWPAHVVGGALGVTGLILGATGMKKKEGKGMAVTGVATSIAGLVLALVSVILIATNQAAWQRRVNNIPVFVPPPNKNNPWR